MFAKIKLINPIMCLLSHFHLPLYTRRRRRTNRSVQIVVKIAQRVHTVLYFLVEQERIVRLVLHSNLYLQVETLHVIVVELGKCLVSVSSVRKRHIQAVLVLSFQISYFNFSRLEKNHLLSFIKNFEF